MKRHSSDLALSTTIYYFVTHILVATAESNVSCYSAFGIVFPWLKSSAIASSHFVCLLDLEPDDNPQPPSTDTIETRLSQAGWRGANSAKFVLAKAAGDRATSSNPVLESDQSRYLEVFMVSYIKIYSLVKNCLTGFMQKLASIPVVATECHTDEANLIALVLQFLNSAISSSQGHCCHWGDGVHLHSLCTA